MDTQKIGQIAGVVVALAPAVVKLIGFIETLFSGKAKSGAEKKDAVMEIVGTVFNAASAISTGGQKETWDNLKEPVSTLIDATVGVLNATVWKSGDLGAGSIVNAQAQ